MAGRGPDDEQRTLVPELLALDRAPDFIEDHGHDAPFGKLTDEEKRAQIEFMKTI